MVILLMIAGTLPFVLTVVTSYCKIVVVIFLVRNALGVQQVPPTIVLSALAMILSVFVMAPVGVRMWEIASQIELPAEMGLGAALDIGLSLSGPIHDFLQANCDERVTRAFMTAALRIWPSELHDLVDQNSALFVVPSFVITELTKAFQIGFLLYLPFICIDLIVSNILLALGMMMVSPMAISLPFKLMLFVTLDGWLKISQGLMYSYSYG